MTQQKYITDASLTPLHSVFLIFPTPTQKTHDNDIDSVRRHSDLNISMDLWNGEGQREEDQSLEG